MISDIRITEADWSRQHSVLSMIRREVFIVEQHVPEDLEWDSFDAECRHLLAEDTGNNIPVGTGRLLADGQIGRIAVLKEYRRRGIGGDILRHLIKLAKRDGQSQVYLHSQVYIVGFYQQAGFRVEGEPFVEAGIEHIKMTMTL